MQFWTSSAPTNSVFHTNTINAPKRGSSRFGSTLSVHEFHNFSCSVSLVPSQDSSSNFRESAGLPLWNPFLLLDYIRTLFSTRTFVWNSVTRRPLCGFLADFATYVAKVWELVLAFDNRIKIHRVITDFVMFVHFGLCHRWTCSRVNACQHLRTHGGRSLKFRIVHLQMNFHICWNWWSQGCHVFYVSIQFLLVLGILVLRNLCSFYRCSVPGHSVKFVLPDLIDHMSQEVSKAIPSQGIPSAGQFSPIFHPYSIRIAHDVIGFTPCHLHQNRKNLVHLDIQVPSVTCIITAKIWCILSSRPVSWFVRSASEPNRCEWWALKSLLSIRAVLKDLGIHWWCGSASSSVTLETLLQAFFLVAVEICRAAYSPSSYQPYDWLLSLVSSICLTFVPLCRSLRHCDVLPPIGLPAPQSVSTLRSLPLQSAPEKPWFKALISERSNSFTLLTW